MKILINYFEEINFDYLEKRIIFLDVDGTLVSDGDSHFVRAVIHKLEKLKKTNQVFLCTNSNDRIRSNKIEEMLGLPIVTYNHKKPSSEIINGLGIDRRNKNLLVTGDKFLTDGLFAKNIGGEFIKVRRKVSGKESFNIKIINFLDDIASKIAKWLKLI